MTEHQPEGRPLKRLLKRVVPRRVVSAVRLQRSKTRVQRALATAPRSPAWLEYIDLMAMVGNYTLPAPYGYDADTLARRGAERAGEIAALVRGEVFERTLEFGCGDGMVSAALSVRGAHAIAVDISANRFDPRAVDAGVAFHVQDATQISVESDSVDCVFSYNAFEHVSDPKAVLAEMIRVTRKGGIIYLSFGPLYWSAFGEHAYRSLPIPYCQCLFRLETINRYCREEGYDQIDRAHVNRWSLRQYRELWDWSATLLSRPRYEERSSAGHVYLIERYPFCFRNRSDFALDFLIDEINVVFRKK